MSLAHKALHQSKAVQKFEFDDQTYTIRRNLMVASSLALAAAFVSPQAGGVYEVNMVIVKGVISNPILLYLFLAVVCLYYVAWFYIHCQKLVIRNYNDIFHSFSYALASLNAQEKFTKLFREHGQQYNQVPTPPFRAKSGGPLNASVNGTLNDHAIRNHPQMEAILQESADFSVSRVQDGIDVAYAHDVTSEDLIFLNAHVDHYWRSRREEWFTAVLPLAFSCIGLFAVGWRICVLLRA